MGNLTRNLPYQVVSCLPFQVEVVGVVVVPKVVAVVPFQVEMVGEVAGIQEVEVVGIQEVVEVGTQVELECGGDS